MDQRVILAVAGSGKTSHIVNSVDPSVSCLLLTYTENNHRNLRDRIARLFGGIPQGTRIYTYFSFLYSFCLRPLCGDEYNLRGINLDPPPQYTRKMTRDDLRHYVDSNGRIYVSRIASFLIRFGLVDEIRQRISKYYERIYVDEVQDFAGYDFNLLISVTANNINSEFVGDFFQHTYDTSRDGNANKGLHDEYAKYKKTFEHNGFYVDEDILGRSYRCSPATCEFVSNNLGIAIESHRAERTLLEFVEDEGRVDAIFRQEQTVKLFYQNHLRYPCFSNNWGSSKGVDDYDSVCVVMNKNTEDYFRKGRLHDLPPITKNKLYVACTRARSELLLVPERLLLKYRQ